MNQPRSLIAVDVGNSFAKFGHFPPDALLETIPRPDRQLQCPTGAIDWARLSGELLINDADWYVASVRESASRQLMGWIGESSTGAEVVPLTRGHLPLALHVDHPDGVGMDRLLGAVAANALRLPREAAIVVDIGTAITVNLVSPSGAFEGGAILPGPDISAASLAEHTEKLPRIRLDALPATPDVLGKSTEPAIQAGIYWGIVGAIHEIVDRMSRDLDGNVTVFLTGGAAMLFSNALGAKFQFEPELKLIGIALAAREVRRG